MSLTKASVASGASENAARPAGMRTGPGGWEPSILWLLGLVLAEIFVVGFLSRHLLKGS